MKNENNYEINQTKPDEPQLKESKKSNKIQTIAIIVGAIVTIGAALVTVFSPEIRKGVYDFFNTPEPTTQSIPSDEPYDPTKQDGFANDDNNTENENSNTTKAETKEFSEYPSTDQNSGYSEHITEKTTTRTSTKAKSTSTTKSITKEPKIIKPKVSLGTTVNSIEFLQIESDNIFVKNRASANVETFYNGFEKQYKEKGSEANTYVVFNVDGYGMCCTIPLKKNGNLCYSGEICDYSKISVGQDESYDKYKFRCFMGTDENNQMILGFSLQKPLATGTYYCLFSIYDSDNGKLDNIYIKFRVK